MHDSFTRRDALKGMVTAGTLALVRPASALLAGPGDVEVSLFSVSPRTVRITVQRAASGKVTSLNSDGALTQDEPGTLLARMNASEAPRTVAAGDLRVGVSFDPLSFSIQRKTGETVQRLSLDRGTSDWVFDLGEGPLFGLGQGGPQFDRRGSTDAMVSGQGGYHLGTHGARVPIQLLVGSAGWGMFVHAPLGAFDLRGHEGRLKADTANLSLPLDVFVIASEEPAGILEEYAKITGYPEMPPLWSLGYQQSHRTLGTPEETMAEARTFREKKLPCDAMIYLGTGFCPNGWNTDNGEFTWNTGAFPDAAGAVGQLHDEHFKVALHVVLEGERLTGTVHDPCTAPPLPSGRTADHHWPPDRQVACYWPVHRPLVEMGIDGWWPDQGDGLDAASRLARNRMYFDGQQMYRPNQRVYALHRNAYAGMQRYAAFLWSGDVLSKWETLKTHVPNAINTGLSGIPYWGTDIGGFIPTDEFTGELYARWFQFAAFCPLFRSHGRDWRLHLPWGWDTGEIGYPETPSYHPDAAEIRNPAIEPICKRYLELRYRLMPYVYSALRETCETGLPMIRALWLHYPDDPVAVARGDEYLFGRDLLVAPVVEKGAFARTLYLPRGEWYDFWTNERIAGGREVTRAVDLATIPLYVRAGAILPTGPVRQYTGEPVDEPLTLTVFPGADGNGFVYQDDGETFDFRKGESMRMEMRWEDRSHRLELRLAQGTRMLGPGRIDLRIERAGSPASRMVRFEGRPVSVKLT
ncbi:MAG TPA: TIM-barrel domain-containing protein [Acidobacteriaceae bacterium]|jgi:alpha-glucosidase/alpha-D-xyloside xylohydrolase|nr:TIM-barrel domain-containing protein [Acidobacteriaceae bacterium]